MNLLNSEIIDNGKGNVLFCEEGVVLENSIVEFEGSNSLVYLSKNRFNYRMTIKLKDNCVFYSGGDSYFNNVVHIVCSEGKHIFMGKDCMFSWSISIRNTDLHPIYDIKTKKRINNSKSVFIGDHVWIGHSTVVLKGTQIDSGCVVGAGSLLSGIKRGANNIYAGNPSKLIRKRAFWDYTFTHDFTPEDSALFEDWCMLAKKKHTR